LSATRASIIQDEAGAFAVPHNNNKITKWPLYIITTTYRYFQMPPKKTARSSSVYLVVIGNVIDSVHASFETANSRSTEAKDKGKDNVRVEIQQLVGGTVTLEPAVEKEIPARVKVIKTESVDDAPKAITAEKKTKVTKPPAEQRVANASKPKGTKGDEDLPDNVKALLKANGDVLNGFAIVVTGVPPVLGRKNAEKLVQLYGGKLTKSLSKNTSFVVVGNDAGPTK